MVWRDINKYIDSKEGLLRKEFPYLSETLTVRNTRLTDPIVHVSFIDTGIVEHNNNDWTFRQQR